MHFVPRRTLPHATPSWVRPGSLRFFTLCCAERGREQLTLPRIAPALLDTVAFYHERSPWFVRLFLLMPDHAHALLAFPAEEKIASCLRDWKRYTAKNQGIVWQRDWFEHRLRNEENQELKAAYIHENPVRQGLVASAAEWPWILET